MPEHRQQNAVWERGCQAVHKNNWIGAESFVTPSNPADKNRKSQQFAAEVVSLAEIAKCPREQQLRGRGVAGLAATRGECYVLHLPPVTDSPFVALTHRSGI